VSEVNMPDRRRDSDDSVSEEKSSATSEDVVALDFEPAPEREVSSEDEIEEVWEWDGARWTRLR
jgi:hypothetical protein